MALWHLHGSLDETDIVKEIPVTKFPFIIGRSTSIDLVVLRSGISREHAEIIKRDGRLFIRDLRSTNGTYVNKQRIDGEVLLTHNTIIHIAQFEFKLIDSEHRSDDELLTVVMSVDESLGLNEKPSKELKDHGSMSAKARRLKAKQLRNDNDAKAVSESELEAADKRLASGSAEGGAILQDDRSNPQYRGDENVFVQGARSDSNRRIDARREVRWPALITLKSQQSIQCVTKDVSEVGFSLKSPINIENLALVKVNIKIFYKGRSREVTALGVVKHSLVTTGGFIVGVQIKSCNNSSSEFISKFSSHKI